MPTLTLFTRCQFGGPHIRCAICPGDRDTHDPHCLWCRRDDVELVRIVIDVDGSSRLVTP